MALRALALALLAWTAGLSWALELTDDERAYMAHKGELLMCVDPEWMPYERINEAGQHEGIAADYLALFAERSGLQITLYPTNSWQDTHDAARERRCDLISMARPTPERHQYLDFTDPYLTYPFVIATTNDKLFVEDLEQVSHQPLAIVKGYAIGHFLRQANPDVQLIEVDNIYDGLQQVRNRQAFGYIDSVLSIGYAIQRGDFLDIKISGKLDFTSSPSIAVRNDEPLLTSILQKAMDAVDEQEKRAIYDRWISIRFEQGFDYGPLLRWIIATALVLLGMFYWNRRLVAANRVAHNALLELSHAHSELQQKNQQLEHLAATDQLTGLNNRLRLHESLRKEIYRFERFRQPLSVIMLDIDHFKQINDEFGHQVGDSCLQDLAHLLQQHTREVDTLGRWGGEEFLVICPQTSLEGARHLAENLRTKIAQHNFQGAGNQTVSFGVASIDAGDSQESLLSRADRALYQAKRNGRNRVESLTIAQ
jgi:diguanylate cyclase (GGDEF)-like protein